MGIVVKWVQPVLFTIPVLNLPVYGYGFCLALAFLACFSFLESDMHRLKMKSDPSMVILLAMVCGIAGSKAHYCLMTDWDEVFSLSTGLSFQGGALGGMLGISLYARFMGDSVIAVLDSIGPLLPLGHAVGKIGCFISGDGCYGVPWKSSFAMSFPHGLVPTKQFVHPTPLYELFLSGGIFWWTWRRRLRTQQRGDQMSMVLILLGLSRVLVEPFRRHDSSYLNGWLTEYQIVGFCFAIFASIVRFFCFRKRCESVEGKKKKAKKEQ